MASFFANLKAQFRPQRQTDNDSAADLQAIRSKARILVIDDNPEAFPFEWLKGEGYRIDHWDKVHSLRELEEGRFEIIVLDIRGVAKHISETHDGLAVIESIKRTCPWQIVVAYSGEDFNVDNHRFFEMCDDCIDKSSEALKYKTVIDGLLERHFTPNGAASDLFRLLDERGLSHKSRRQVEKVLAKAKRHGRLHEVQGQLEIVISAEVQLPDEVLQQLGVLALRALGAFSGIGH
jgi:CheY-like chemotaxis protein